MYWSAKQSIVLVLVLVYWIDSNRTVSSFSFVLVVIGTVWRPDDRKEDVPPKGQSVCQLFKFQILGGIVLLMIITVMLFAILLSTLTNYVGRIWKQFFLE